MKATLKHVANQYILIVDERPKEFKDYWIYIGFDEPLIINTPLDLPNWFGKLWDKENYFKIIAAENLDGVKGIMIERNDNLIVSAQQYALSSNRTDCITKIMNAYLDGFNQAILYKSIDTEVEVTEEEDYYLIGL